jgi:hypothetical protein
LLAMFGRGGLGELAHPLDAGGFGIFVVDDVVDVACWSASYARLVPDVLTLDKSASDQNQRWGVLTMLSYFSSVKLETSPSYKCRQTHHVPPCHGMAVEPPPPRRRQKPIGASEQVQPPTVDFPLQPLDLSLARW